MPAKDTNHEQLKNALINDGWTITHDPLSMRVGRGAVFVDLGAEKLLIAEKENRKIAAELKTFGGASEVRELEQAFGQYFVYLAVMGEIQPDRVLYLAISRVIFEDVFAVDLGKLLLQKYNPNMIIFDPETEEIVQWIP